jgi:hypothetical protein
MSQAIKNQILEFLDKVKKANPAGSHIEFKNFALEDFEKLLIECGFVVKDVFLPENKGKYFYYYEWRALRPHYFHISYWHSINGVALFYWRGSGNLYW